MNPLVCHRFLLPVALGLLVATLSSSRAESSRLPVDAIAQGACSSALGNPSSASTSNLTRMAPGSMSGTQELTGLSGGFKESDCGCIPETPSQQIELTEPFPVLQLTLQGDPDLTLLVEGPKGRFCNRTNPISGDSPTMSGYWGAGTYNIYVGDRPGEQREYTLVISR